MARQKNDGRGRLGGRSKGTSNKATTTLKEWISVILDENRVQFEADLKEMLPAERVRVMSQMFGYIVPKQQAISMEAQIETEYRQLQKLLISAPDEAIDRIANRVLYFLEQKKNPQIEMK